MTEPSAKRSREGLGDELGPDTLKGVAEALRETDVSVFYGLKAFITHIQSSPNDIYRVFHSTYVEDVENLGQMIVPASLRQFTTIRDPKTSKVTCIHDDKDKLKGPRLNRMLGIETLKSKGYDVIIFNEDKDNATTSCLALYKFWQIEEDIAAKKKEFHKKLFKVYTDRGFTRIYVAQSDLIELLSLSYVSLNKAKTLASRLNAVAERQELSFEVAKMKKLKHILDAQGKETKSIETAFLEELLAANVESTPWKTKLHAFKKMPGPSMARRLQLTKPYQGKCIEQSTNREATLHRVADLEDGDMVQMSTVSLDTKFYHSVSGDISEWKVYKASPTLGVVRDKKGWVKLDQPSMDVKHFVSMMETIKGDNEASGTGTNAKPPSQPEPEGLGENIDI